MALAYTRAHNKFFWASWLNNTFSMKVFMPAFLSEYFYPLSKNISTISYN